MTCATAQNLAEINHAAIVVCVLLQFTVPILLYYVVDFGIFS